jgi:hypothetical protein
MDKERGFVSYVDTLSETHGNADRVGALGGTIAGADGLGGLQER